MQFTRSGHAVVIGGSMAGILSARVLADHFETVTLIERDVHEAAPNFRRGVPQGRHAHALLLRGQQTMLRLFPEAHHALMSAGATVINMGRDMRWFHFGVWKHRYVSGLVGLCASRPLIEWTLSEHLRKLPNLRTSDGASVESLLFEHGRVAGVRMRPRGDAGVHSVRADLVVDASGRGSHTPAQLAAQGFEQPKETSIKIDVGYATRIYRPSAAQRDWKVLYVISQAPSKRGALILPIEPDQGGARWMVTQVGMHGDHPPADDRGFLEFAKTLPAQDVYEALRDAEPLTPITRYGYLAAQRRYYERLRRFPENLLVLGDALCSFNPVYGQGMSAAAMYADALAETLQARAAHGGRVGLWRDFFARTSRVADMPWSLATGEDFRFKETIGKRSAVLRLLHWYTSKAQVAAGRDALVAERLHEVMHLLRPPTSIMNFDVMWRLINPHVEAREPPVWSLES